MKEKADDLFIKKYFDSYIFKEKLNLIHILKYNSELYLLSFLVI